MLEFWVNGKEVRISAIYSKGKVGQAVIFGRRVNLGENPDSIKYPLSQYPYLSIFTIIEKKDGKDGYYILRDAEGKQIKLQDEYYGASNQYLFDAQEWLNFNDMRESEIFSHKERKISQLEGHLDLLKDILVKQGIRVVTEEQAKKLGLK